MKHEIKIEADYLLLDCDGVMLNFTKGFQPFAEMKIGRKLNIDDIVDFDLSKWTGVTPEENLEMITEFMATEAYSQLEPYDGALELLDAARAAGMITEIITSAANGPRHSEMRHTNVGAAFGDRISYTHIVGMAGSKHALLSSYPKATWVEDNFNNAIMGAEIGHRTFIVRDGHNLVHEGKPIPENMTWVNDLHELRQTLFG